jgi:predicted MFS family arabinose efflux permease
MPVTATEVVAEFHRPPREAFGENVRGSSNRLRLRLSPEVVIALGVRVKLAGIAMASLFGWRGALLGAAAIGAVVVALLVTQRDELQAAPARAQAAGPGLAALAQLPILMCFSYFLMLGIAFIAVQTFGIPAMVQLYGMSVALASAALTTFLVGGATGIFVGGFVAVRATRHDLVAVFGMAASATLFFALASGMFPAALVPAVMGLAGFAGGLTNPSRDLIVRAATPVGATGKVYGFVYSGLDVGSIAAPVLFGWLLDRGEPSAVFYAVVVVLALSIFTVLRLPARAVPVSGQPT